MCSGQTNVFSLQMGSVFIYDTNQLQRVKLEVAKQLATTSAPASAPGSAQLLTNGLPIATARQAMEAAGYRQTGLDMLPSKPNDQLQYWAVGQGVLIIGYSKASEAITGLAFSLSDERPKAFRKTFDFEVTSFDTATGLMVIRTKRGEPPGAANQGQPPTQDPPLESAVVGLWRFSIPSEPQQMTIRIDGGTKWAWWAQPSQVSGAEPPTQSGTWFIRKGTLFLRVQQTQSDKIIPNMVFAFDLKSATSNAIVADWNSQEIKCERVR
jgi:hypothetical protein